MKASVLSLAMVTAAVATLREAQAVDMSTGPDMTGVVLITMVDGDIVHRHIKAGDFYDHDPTPRPPAPWPTGLTPAELLPDPRPDNRQTRRAERALQTRRHKRQNRS